MNEQMFILFIKLLCIQERFQKIASCVPLRPTRGSCSTNITQPALPIFSSLTSIIPPRILPITYYNYFRLFGSNFVDTYLTFLYYTLSIQQHKRQHVMSDNRKMKTMYEVRHFPTPNSYSKGLGRKFRTYRSACRIVRALKARGLEVFKVPIRVRVQSG